ncbi:hypothetical protein ACFL2F_05310, partial [Myxococcota bacterium]
MRINKTLVGLCLLAALLAPAAAAEELFLSVDFEQPVHSTRVTGDVLAVPGADLMGRPGEPLLPQKTLYFLLPYGHQAVDVRLSELVVEPLDGIYDISPAQRPVHQPRLGMVGQGVQDHREHGVAVLELNRAGLHPPARKCFFLTIDLGVGRG